MSEENTKKGGGRKERGGGGGGGGVLRGNLPGLPLPPPHPRNSNGHLAGMPPSTYIPRALEKEIPKELSQIAFFL